LDGVTHNTKLLALDVCSARSTAASCCSITRPANMRCACAAHNNTHLAYVQLGRDSEGGPARTA